MSSRVGVNLRASAYLHQGDRKYMEDEFQVAYQRTQDKKDIEYAFFGIFDGHGGKEAANFAKDYLMDNIVSQRLFWSDNDEDVLCAIKEGFLQTHLLMWKVLGQWPRTASGWPSTSGTTASIAFIRRQKIYIGHVGDSGIVLGYEDEGIAEWLGESLTRDHKPESAKELHRINECGGKVVEKSGVPRVVWHRPKSGHQGPVRRSTPMDEIPFLAVARSLGDLWSYNPINDRFVVSPEPDVCVIDIDINVHRCLIFGTDGLWNALSPNSVVNTAYFTEKNNEKHYLGIPSTTSKARLWLNPSRSIVSGALNRYQGANLRADNTSAITVFLDPPGRPKREVLLSQYSMERGLPCKNSSPKTQSKKMNREASVQVHVYNQSQNVQDQNRSLFQIKEHVPPSDWTDRPPEDRRRSVPDLSFLNWNRKPEDDVKKDESETCLECGCHSPNSKNKVPPPALDKSYREEESNTSPKNDIQIPVISSSTTTENIVNSQQTVNNNRKPYLKDSRRRTRSCVSLPVRSKSENKVGHKGTKLSKESLKLRSSIRHSALNLNNTDASCRILKSVNRGGVDPKLMSQKRKRQREVINCEEERTPTKALCVHTRSHTLSHKPMVTRSQDKSHNKIIRSK